MRRRSTLVAVGTAALSWAAPVWAQRTALPERRAGLHWTGGTLAISVGVQDLFTGVDPARLTSGFATRVLIRVVVTRVGQSAPVAHAVRHTEIVYDLWDERFRVRRTDGDGRVDVRDAPDAASAMGLATALIRFPVASRARLVPGALYRITLRADLNPLSQELIAEVRRWLSRPAGAGRLSPGDTFFGSVVSVFVNPQIEESERRVIFAVPVFAYQEPPR